MIRWISAPLDVEGWEVVESLEDYALYPEYEARIDECLQLIAEGQAFWQPYRDTATADDAGSWQPVAEHTVGEVRRLAYNIRQLAERYGGDLAGHVRSSLGAYGDDIADPAYVAAMGIDRACRAIERISRWLVDFDDELAADWGPALKATLVERPDLYEVRINQTRNACAIGEGETREALAELVATAKRYIEQAANMQLAENARTQLARKGGQKSGVKRRKNNEERDKAICDKGRALQRRGVADHELSGVIAQTIEAEGLTSKSIRRILREGGVIN